jgi:hypothetical protein
MDQPILSDKNQFPSEEVIFSHIGKSKTLWKAAFEYIRSNHPDFSEEWRYYNDGKSWLMKVTHKKKTVFWLSVIKGAFRTTFYFTDRAETAIKGSLLSGELKRQFLDGKKFGKIKGLTVSFKNKKDVEHFKALIGIKLSVK